jgi:hypothetical protein
MRRDNINESHDTARTETWRTPTKTKTIEYPMHIRKARVAGRSSKTTQTKQHVGLGNMPPRSRVAVLWLRSRYHEQRDEIPKRSSICAHAYLTAGYAKFPRPFRSARLPLGHCTERSKSIQRPSPNTQVKRHQPLGHFGNTRDDPFPGERDSTTPFVFPLLQFYNT